MDILINAIRIRIRIVVKIVDSISTIAKIF